jgi:hypothetical protein
MEHKAPVFPWLPKACFTRRGYRVGSWFLVACSLLLVWRSAGVSLAAEGMLYPARLSSEMRVPCSLVLGMEEIERGFALIQQMNADLFFQALT